ncbi:vesicle transport protein [Phlyctochytrium arcticum]|nr:vesicle transport protein [Phlyctochytrium arcticum]
MRQSNVKPEVNLRRLLNRCEASLSPTSSQDIVDPAKYESNIIYLHRLLSLIEQDPSRSCDDSILSEYKRRVEQLETLLDRDRLLSSVGRTVSSLRNLTVLSDGDGRDVRPELEATNSMLALQRRAEDDIRMELLGRQDSKGSEAKETPMPTPSLIGYDTSLGDARDELLSTPQRDLRKRRPSMDKSSITDLASLTEPPSQSQILARDKRLHEQMTQELSTMARQLKMNSLALSEGLKKDAKVVSEASTHLNANTTRLSRESTRLTKLNASARTTTWIKWMVVIGVCLVFVLTVGVMRVVGPRRTFTTTKAPKVVTGGDVTNIAQDAQTGGSWWWT